MYTNILRTSILFKQIIKYKYNSLRKLSSESNDVIIESIKDKGLLTLNRPKTLNSLDLSMVNKILNALLKWEKEKNAVIVKGAGDKAFCAGADVKSIVVANRKGDKIVGQNFFKQEYIMNGVIGTYNIPYIAFIDGIVMGGGVGLSVHGQYRIATERTLFAMPETKIGLFPDVGTSYFLPRLTGKLGIFLALTGARLKGYDNFKSGIATHYVASKSLPDLLKSLLDCKSKSEIDQTLKKFSKTENTEFSLAPYMKTIDKCFAAATVEGIIKNLKEEKSEWAKEVIKILSQMSPTSMKVSKELLDRGSKLTSLKECLQLEYYVAYNTLNHKDFNEGVRALLIDKDQRPKWSPATLEEVPTTLVQEFFQSVPGGIKKGLKMYTCLTLRIATNLDSTCSNPDIPESIINNNIMIDEIDFCNVSGIDPLLKNIKYL